MARVTRKKPQLAKAVVDPAEPKRTKLLDKVPAETRLGWLKNGNPPGDFTKAARCGAKTRRGTGCEAPAMPNGRCRMHGGLSTGPKTAEGKDRIRKAVTKHGRYSAAAKLRRERYLQVLQGPYFDGMLELLESLRDPTEKSLYLVPGAEAEWDPAVAAMSDDDSTLITPDSSGLQSSGGPSMDLESNTEISNDGGKMPGSRTSESWQWSPSKETAASLVAEGRLPIYEIAQQVGVSEKTIDRWKKRPAFRARVDGIVTDFRNHLFAESLRRLESRFAMERPHAKRAKRPKLLQNGREV